MTKMISDSLAAKPDGEFRPDRIFELSAKLSTRAGESIGEITSVNRMAKMLAMNAMVVAARAGEAGKGFGIVAEEFKKLATEIDLAAASLESQVRTDLEELTGISGAILERMRHQRLIDLALNAIEIIDRNLYERTCDARWWATDSAVVDCLANPEAESAQHATRRLKVILDSYTVYLDLWICDTDGRVVANGRPDRYPKVPGTSVAKVPWFEDALKLRSGEDFTVGDIDASEALLGAPVATYATAIREKGLVRGKVIGVLGIHFDWRPQAQAVVEGVRLTDEERGRSRVMILDQNHRILAASDSTGALNEVVSLQSTGSGSGSYSDGANTIGFALTPGYETYKGLGWYGCIIQRNLKTNPSTNETRAISKPAEVMRF
ncbi:MAG: methyl-accepting chemotaxis protein [Beijerinckiaceae bacterium]|nr:methyl-accepting chemotaxis protein [Beijerinckiaceae bacterium]